MPTASPQQIIHAYRHLYRGLLHAVQFSKPARFTARDQLRDAFRNEDSSKFDQQKVNNTVEFLRLATKEAGIEHRLVKNLLLINRGRRQRLRRQGRAEIQKDSMNHYDMTIAMLNDNMGLCLR
ncbi:hypothetical protein B0O99DRAFT_649070 [Bisporella sp. PMI_857]|nr:hypothetical protein B0O99DRAFT_649070 [Bisporella sp. PMI_857]